jgi:hypothetical protein
MTNKTRAIRPTFEYAPFRKYHARRVKNLRGSGLIGHFKFLYEYDGEFRLQTDFILGGVVSFVAAIGIITILIIVLG